MANLVADRQGLELSFMAFAPVPGLDAASS